MYVFVGCPAQGYYEENCSKPCPQNCQNGGCYISNETCIGCVAGYKRERSNKGK